VGVGEHVWGGARQVLAGNAAGGGYESVSHRACVGDFRRIKSEKGEGKEVVGNTLGVFSFGWENLCVC